MNILILDDDENIGKILKILVENYGHTANVFNMIDDAVKFFMTNEVDWVITDYYLNDERYNGSQVIDILKRYKEIPCIIITGKVDTSDIKKNYECLIDKAFIMNELEECIRKFTDKSSTQSQ